MNTPASLPLFQSRVVPVVVVSDAAQAVPMAEALLAAGAAIAAALGPLRDRVSGQRVGIIICGANIDCSTYQELLARGHRFIARSA